MENILLDQVLQQVRNREISIEKARELISVLFNVSNNEVALKAFVEEYVEAFEDGQGSDTALYRQAKSLL